MLTTYNLNDGPFVLRQTPPIVAWILALPVLAYAGMLPFWPSVLPISAMLPLPLFDPPTVPFVGIAASSIFAILPMLAGLSFAHFMPNLRGAVWVAMFSALGILPAIIFGVIEVAFLSIVPLWLALRGDKPTGAAATHRYKSNDSSIFGFSRRNKVRKGDRSQQLIIDLMDDGLISIDRGGVITSMNRAAEQLLGTNCIDQEITRFLTVLRQPEFADLTAIDRYRVETTVQRESSAVLAVEFSLTGQGDGENWTGVIRISDNSDRAREFARLEKLALHDSLTGLPNRVLYLDRIAQAISIAERRNETMAVMLLDLNKFKQVNDTLGHHVGDLLLQAVGPRLSGPLRQTDTLARLGGDEFAVLLPPSTDQPKATEVAERLVDALIEPFIIEGMTLDLGVSVGVAMYPEHGVDPETLIHNADMAMYQAKRQSLGATMFNTTGDQAMTRRVKLQHELRSAIDNGDLEVLYQPKVSTNNWQVTGFEALVRWQHPEFGVLPPSDFIPLAEQTGLIMPLTLAVVNNCLSAQRVWREDGFDLSVAVNLSPKWLNDAEFPRILRLLLENWHGRADRLILEIPESAIMVNPTETTLILRQLRDQGLELSLDDFCTGYSSLPVLQRLPVQELKIDQRFIGEMIKDQNAAIVVGAVIKLAHSLGLRVVAEGVENQSVAEWLGSLEGDELQGYFFGRPMIEDEVPAWVSHSRSNRRPRESSRSIRHNMLVE